ncbi:MAG: phospho-N-acetylmuramoyl-pentapeptide-transferase [Oscillospiraceae bacterium]|nr:phospho-N-acetylmuramoyl-pentapeptide-transferase [Oscillospiraceae bacterium]
MISKILFAFIVALLVTVIAGLVLIPALRRANLGQSIREDGPVWHSGKAGTPTMGGFMFVIGTSIACITVGFSSFRTGEFLHLQIFLFALVYGVIGFYDDYRKLKKKQNEGLTARGKFLLQLLISVLYILIVKSTGKLSAILYIPFVNISIPLPNWIYVIFLAFVAIGTVNAVNITDGVDGLATGSALPVAICFGAIAFVLSNPSLGIFAGALAGSLAGFLVFNFHPAKVFMGDIGSHFLGGAICAMAYACDMPLLLITVGIIFVIEALSDIIQVTYFKITKGKRIFKMAPLHHHLEMSGWSEYKLFAVFTSISTVFSIISFLGVYSAFS